jgi:hypothetical protein
MIKKTKNKNPFSERREIQTLFLSLGKQKTPKQFCRSKRRPLADAPSLEHGFHNVSRWMTWLPISLKNAAKCDKWYQLQNHSITESLNANGAREKPSTAYPVHAVFSVSNKNPTPQKSLGLSETRFTSCSTATGWLPRKQRRQNVDSWVIHFLVPNSVLLNRFWNNKRTSTIRWFLQKSLLLQT